MTFTDAAAEVLRLVGRPLHYKEITDIAIEKNLLSHVGKSPEVTMGARLAAMLKKDSPENPLVRVKPGVFALREWDEKTIKAGLESKRGAKKGAKDSAKEGHRGRSKVEEAPRAPIDEEEVEEAAAPEAAESDEEEADEAEAAPVTEEAEAEETQAAEYSAGETGETEDEDAEDASDNDPLIPAATPSATQSRPAMPFEDEEDEEPPGPDEAMRAEAVAGAAEMFDEEEDDDQPILGGTDDRAGAGVGAQEGEGRRRRRRRRRGRGGSAESERTSSSGLPSYVATPAFDNSRQPRDPREGREPRDSRDMRDPRDVRDPRDSRDMRDPRDSRDMRDPRDSRDMRDPRDSRDMRDPRDSRDMRDPRDSRDLREGRDNGGREIVRESRDAFPSEGGYRGPQVIELTGGDAHALDDLAGRDVSDAVAAILSTFDRNAGAVSLRQIAETAQRRGRLSGDVQLVQSQVAAAVRADNARRLAAGQRPRFRFAGGRVALTDWLLSGELARFEQEALAAVERYRDASRRAFARKLGELPGHAFVEVCVLALERIGVGQIRAIRRAGASGGETHFAGMLKTPADEIRVAIVIRRDGREVGRERVTELRGSLHHYASAMTGWILTGGQVLSGAREEASVAGAAPISLYDGLAVARLCEENDVAVLRARLPIAIPDVDLLEALRAS